jgi:cation diffusion facilitator family transporter
LSPGDQQSAADQQGAGQQSGRGQQGQQGGGHQETRRTVIVAACANVIVGITKLVAGILSGSSSMLAEAAHSAADTLNQIFLLTSVSRGDRPPDRGHPFGYGQERYFWSLMAAFGIFVAGGGFSIFEGILALHSTGKENAIAAYIALAIAFVAEGTSFLRAYRQLHGEARRAHQEMLDHVQSSVDTTVKAALFEDTAAVIGLVFAALGVGLRQLTGSPVWDGAGSIAIGVLLIVVAVKLGKDSRDLLIGRAASPELVRQIAGEVEGTPGVEQLLELRTMHIGPDSLIVAARVALDDSISAGDAEQLADDIDRRLCEKLPVKLHVFVDPTGTPDGDASAAAPRSA